MCTRILRTSTMAAALLSMALVTGCGSDSTPLAVLPDVDQSSEGTETAGSADTDTGDESSADSSSDTDNSDAGDSETTTDNNEASTEDSDTAANNEAANEATSEEGGDAGTPVAAVFEAVYRATFVATWSVETHPINFPADPHFSPLTGAVHSEQSVFWEMGQNASDGIEQMAETGATGILITEIQAAIDEGRALSAIQGGGIPESPGSTSVEFTINRDSSLVTLVSMLAPSPDWFIGVNSLQMLDENGDFRPSVTVDLSLYDSGTDGGTRFTSADEDIPRSPIDLVNSFPLDSDFQGGQPAVGQLTLELIQ